MNKKIAIVGIGCLYPDAKSPVELWENALAQRRAFRRMPAERLRLADYFSEDRRVPDSIYATEAALIEGYTFDRLAFQVPGDAFRAADMAHWLALDIAARALVDAGFPKGDGLPRDTTGVLLGNTLTGEFSRTNILRLRWPYVRRVVEASLAEATDGPQEQSDLFLERLEETYKNPFPAVGEETLAGGLSNTIAGRICNHFDLKGGGYTLDGACASSLLAVANACSALRAGDLDVALAGGVDLSLDPFELVGFAAMGALAPSEMRVYDARSAGFWPGEGCGFVVLMRYEEAVREGRRIYAAIRGWGISSDGSSGITRPVVEGQLLALNRAYHRAGFGIDTVSYFEGHGTGTEVGDATELQALSRARREAGAEPPPAVIGSIKANIGHTKAASGVAGLIKATMALHTQILPPTPGCEQPHPALTRDMPVLQVQRKGEPWPTDRPLRAGVSAMGFGGINAHIVLEGVTRKRRRRLSRREGDLLSSAQDAELFLMAAQDTDALRQQVEHLLTLATRLSRAELADLAAQMERNLPVAALRQAQGERISENDGQGEVRAAVVASTPAEFAARLETLRSWLTSGTRTGREIRSDIFLGAGTDAPRIGFLFPGQGSPADLSGGALCRRFACVQALYERAGLPAGYDGIATEVAQPAIVTASMAGLRLLDLFGIRACIACGHSLGELSAYHWAGAFDEPALLRIATVRGKAMAESGSPTAGAMAGIGAGADDVERLLDGAPVVIAGMNSPHQTIISGEATAVARIVSSARARGLRAVNLSVSHAFHSPLVAAAAPVLAGQLAREKFTPLQRTVVSTVTGAPLAPDADLLQLLHHQITSPVRFEEAATRVAKQVDLLIEVGPGEVLRGLLCEFVDTPVVALDAGGPSLTGLLKAIGAAFALGTPINHNALFAGRFTRPFNLDWHPGFFVNPCELAPVTESAAQNGVVKKRERKDDALSDTPPRSATESPLDLVRRLVAQRVELPIATVKDGSRMLSDLNLNSIAVSQLVVEAARRLGLPPPVSPMDYANAKVVEIAQALEEIARTGGATPVDEAERLPLGVDGWIRPFTVALVERPLPRRPLPTTGGLWRVIASQDHPLRNSLQQSLSRLGHGGGVVVCMPPEPDERHVGLLLEGARAVLAEGVARRFVLVQHGGGGAAFARTLHLETPDMTTCVVDVPWNHPQATEWVVAEAMAADGYTEAHYDDSGWRWEPVLRLLPTETENEATQIPLDPSDLLLVTGGGKGIAAECALAMARETGVRLALLGRSQPTEDADLSANLDRMTAHGIRFRYIVADVTDPEAVRAAVSRVESGWGPVTGILHGAGRNVPKPVNALDETDVLRTLAPKVQGARNLLAAIRPETLRLFVTFGSIIARTGLPGEADYGLANEWLVRLTERFQTAHPACRCLALEWSVWSGVGMGARLGRVDTLARQGVTPIPQEVGLSMLRRLLSQRLPTVAVVVAGRFGNPPTLKTEQPDLPLLRFLERPRVYYPGVELIVEAELSVDTDPYLSDHIFQGERLFPAVMGLEAMAQVGMALSGAKEPPLFEEVAFDRPIVVPRDASVSIRIAALVRAPDSVEVVLRTQETAFQVDHFRGLCRFRVRDSACGVPSADSQEPASPEEKFLPVGIDPERDLYGGILFHRGRFRRLRRYWQLRATACLAEVTLEGTTDWFGHYLPGKLVLGDPAARDATLHAVQACIPHMTLLPIGVDRLIPGVGERHGPRYVSARERSREGNTFVYDLEVTGADGRVCERWEGIRLRAMEGMGPIGDWIAPLLGPYIERRLQEMIPGSAVTVVVARNTETDRHAQSDQAIQQLVGETVLVQRRLDGKPEMTGHGGVEVSTGHAGTLTLAIAGPGPIGCDVEPVVARPTSVWQDLLGPERFNLSEVIAQERDEAPETAATRVWGAGECLKKVGAMANTPLVLLSSTTDGWVQLAAGPLTISTFVTNVNASRLVFSVACKK